MVRVEWEKPLDNQETKYLEPVPRHGVDWYVVVLLRMRDDCNDEEHNSEEHCLSEVDGAFRKDRREEASEDDEQER